MQQIAVPTASLTIYHASRTRLRTDMAVVIGFTLAVGLLAWQFEFSERIFHWTRTREHYQIDELPVVMLAFALLMLWFSHRRFQEAQSALRHRDAAEQQLAHLLEENRQLARRTIDVQEAERRNLARELHDEMGQYLNAIKIDAVSLQRSYPPVDDRTPDSLNAIVRNVNHVYWVINDMIRRLRPVGLDELGLAAAVENCVDGWRQRLAGTEFMLTINGDISGLDEQTNLTIYRIVQEGLTNVAKHADASRVDVLLARQSSHGLTRNAEILVSMRDDGRGASESSSLAATGLGLIGMRERVQALGGELILPDLPTQGPGFGFTARIPVAHGRTA